MGNSQIPRAAERIEHLTGVDKDGNTVKCSVYRHVRAGQQAPMFFVVQYRMRGERIDPSSRVTREFSGPRAGQRLESAMTEVRDLLARSRRRSREEGVSARGR